MSRIQALDKVLRIVVVGVAVRIGPNFYDGMLRVVP